MTESNPPRTSTPWPRSVLLLTLGAISLRLLLFLGRGAYVAFDEGWYLLLGRSLWSGDGYTLSGLPHVALSPLFPILAGGMGRVLGDPVWGGRLVAAVASGLLILPCWSIFQRLAPPRTAWVGLIFVAVTPSLAPFVVPYWVGWDLWVGAEPLLHLFLFTGIALSLRAWEVRSWIAALGSGSAFALAYLARPEAVGTFAFVGLTATVLTFVAARVPGVKAPPVRKLIPLAGAAAVAFVLVAGPYWIYLHGELGRWSLTGRAVQLAPTPLRTAPTGGGPAPTNRIEDMLWRGDESAYVRTLYALDASGTRLANNYWGIQPPEVPSTSVVSAVVPTPDILSEAQGGATTPTTPSVTAGSAVAPSSTPPPPTSWVSRYAAALGVVVPWYLWIFVTPGLLVPARARRLDLEALVVVPLVVTSVAIVRIVAIDPRTQLLLVPLAAFYAGRGAVLVGDLVSARLGAHVRTGLAPKLLVGALAVTLLTTSLADLTLSLTVGSPHHIVAAQNATVGSALRESTPENATVVSFHPALALFADRDWRVLPLEPMDRIVRYARTQPTPYLVLSVFYPPEVRPLEEPHYLIVPVDTDTPDSRRWRIDVDQGGTVLAFGRLAPENRTPSTGDP